MGRTEDDDWPGKGEQRILRQLDRMVASGRITPDEAERLRGADGPAAFEAVLGAVRARHAGMPLDAAVADGQLSQSEAENLRQRLRRGEHGPDLRKHLRQWRHAHDRASDD